MLLEWYTLIFTVPLLVSLVLMLFSAGLGGGGRLGHGHHGGVHAGHAHHGGVHAGHGHHGAAHAGGHGHHATLHGAAAGSHGHAHHQAAHESAVHEGGPSVGRQVLGWFGVGRAPVTLLLWSFWLGWGFAGFWSEQLLARSGASPVLYVLPAMGVALVGGLLLAKGTAEVAARVMPREESTAIGREGLLGRIGEIVFPTTESAGRIHVYDDYGTLHDESCRVAPGQPSLAKGTRAMVVSIDAEARRLIVEQAPF
jgi:hypothetical protein